MDLTPAQQGALDTLEEDLRKIGIYAQSTDLFPDPDDPEAGAYLLLDAQLGDFAFSDKVQKPEKARDDRAVAEMGIDLHRTDFDDTREEIRRRLAEGKPILGSED